MAADASGFDENRLKLMLVGQENVGKTSLLIALKAFFVHGFKKKKTTIASRKQSVVAETKKKELESKGGQLTGDTLSTDGIDIETLQYNSQTVGSSDKEKKEDKKASASPIRNISFSCWDFGGQEVYYTTHAFFLSERSVFLLVWNITMDEKNSRVSYWLNTVKTHAPNAPVILVATHLDELKGDEKEGVAESLAKIEKKYRKQHKSVQGAFAVSTQSGKGMEELIRKLEEVSANVLVSYPKPTQTYVALEKSFTDTKQQLIASGRPPVITWTDFVQLAVKANVIRANVPDSQMASQMARLEKASEYFHMLGSIFDFNPDPTLAASPRRIVILDVQWIAKVFSTVCSTKNGYARNGTISITNLFTQIWRDYPADVHVSLLSLFESFEIIYRTPGQEDTLLIPSMLPENTPGDVKQLFHAVSPSSQYLRHYELEFIPNGLFSRFMVRLMRYGNIQRVWRRGILIASSTVDAMALVEMKPSANVISVQMRGADESAELFVQVCEIMEFLMQHMFHITAKIKYVDPANPTITFSREQLEDWSTKGQWMIPCGKGIIPLANVAPDLALTNADSLQIDVEKDVEIGEQLGEGAFATVYKGTLSGEVVAVKRLNMKGKDDIQNQKIFGEFRREVLTMSALHHPCVVNLKAFSLKLPYSIIMEYIPHGSLYGFLKDRRATPIPWSTRLRIAYDIAAGMAHLHSIDPPLIHKDLKSPNILMAAIEDNAPAMAKVADFGISGKLYMNMFSAKKARDREVENPTWLAPEIIREEPYSAASDVYPFGIMLWELLTQQHPYEEFNFSFNSDLEDAIKKGQRPTVPADCPASFRSLIEACWHDDPTKRPTFAEVISDLLPPIINELAPALTSTLKEVQQIHAAMDEQHRADRELLRKQREEKRKAQIEEEKRRKEEEQRELFRMLQEREAMGSTLGPGLGDTVDDQSPSTEFAAPNPMAAVAAAAAGAAKAGSWRNTIAAPGGLASALQAAAAEKPAGPSAVANAAAAAASAPVPQQPAAFSPPSVSPQAPTRNSLGSKSQRASVQVSVSLEMLESSPYQKLDCADLRALITNRGLPAPGEKDDKDNFVLTLVRDDAILKMQRRPKTEDEEAGAGPGAGMPAATMSPPASQQPGSSSPQIQKPASPTIQAVPAFKGPSTASPPPATAAAVPGSAATTDNLTSGPVKRPTRPAAASVAVAYGTLRGNSLREPGSLEPLPSSNSLSPGSTPPAARAKSPMPPPTSTTPPAPPTAAAGPGVPSLGLGGLAPPQQEAPMVSPKGPPKLPMLGQPAGAPAGPLKLGAAPPAMQKMPLLGMPPPQQQPQLGPLGAAPGAAGRARPQSMALPQTKPMNSPPSSFPPKAPAPAVPQATPPAGAPSGAGAGAAANALLAPVLPADTPVSGVPQSREGQWSIAAGTAGGSPMSNTWRRCPQFQLAVTSGGPSKVKISLSQDEASTLPYIGFYVFVGTPDGKKKIDLQNAIVYQPPHFMNIRDIEATLELKEGSYMIMPAIYHPNIEGKFKLTIQGDRVQLSAASDWPGVAEVAGEWKPGQCGGCMNNPTWKQNPTFKLKITGGGRTFVTLTPDRRDVGMGFYVFNASNPNEPIAKSMFTMVTVLREVNLPPGEYTILPSTFQANIAASFVLAAYGDAAVALSAM